MKLVILVAVAAVVFASFKLEKPKEQALFIGHAQYQNKTVHWCVVRAIKADSHKQADSLFRLLVDSLVIYDKAVLTKTNYDVWELDPGAVLKINEQPNLRGF